MKINMLLTFIKRDRWQLVTIEAKEDSGGEV